MASPIVTVAIPTFRRTGPLRAALASVAAQEGIDLAESEILVIDNSPEGSAAWVTSDVGLAKMNLTYLHVPDPGFARVRNAAVAAAGGTYLAFLDDDETASPAWLSELVGTLEVHDADAAFGPVVPAYGCDGPANERAFLDRIFGRRFMLKDGADLGRDHARLGTGNSIFRMATCFKDVAPFDGRADAGGGEDTLFLRALVRARRRLVWSPRAEVQEHVPAERCNVSALRLRRFRQGQMRALACHAVRPADPAGLFFWMIAGLVQGCWHSFMASAQRLIGKRRAAIRSGIQAMGGWGKLLWWRDIARRMPPHSGTPERRPSGAQAEPQITLP